MGGGGRVDDNGASESENRSCYGNCKQKKVRPNSNTSGVQVLLSHRVQFPAVFSRSRWIKFEEKVEKGGERWSKPHVATLSLHSLFELRTCIEKGTIMLDMEASTLPQVVGRSLPSPAQLVSARSGKVHQTT